MELKELCLAVVEEMKKLVAQDPQVELHSKKQRYTIRYVTEGTSALSLYLVVDVNTLTINGTIKLRRTYQDDFVAKVDIKKKMRIYNHTYPLCDVWKPFHELLNQYQ